MKWKKIEKIFLQLLSDYDPRGRRDQVRLCERRREHSFNIIVILLNLEAGTGCLEEPKPFR